jgi:hypothetical protein
LRLFLWDKPQPKFWASIFIDGKSEWTDKDGTKHEKSRNRHQDTCMAASNYAGSALEAMLGGVDDLPGAPVADDGATPSDEPEDGPEDGPETPNSSMEEAATDAPEEELSEMEELGL